MLIGPGRVSDPFNIFIRRGRRADVPGEPPLPLPAPRFFCVAKGRCICSTSTIDELSSGGTNIGRSFLSTMWPFPPAPVMARCVAMVGRTSAEDGDDLGDSWLIKLRVDSENTRKSCQKVQCCSFFNVYPSTRPRLRTSPCVNEVFGERCMKRAKFVVNKLCPRMSGSDSENEKIGTRHINARA